MLLESFITICNEVAGHCFSPLPFEQLCALLTGYPPYLCGGIPLVLHTPLAVEGGFPCLQVHE